MNRRPSAFISRLARHEGGVTMVEFALIFPMFAMVIMAIFDISFNLYTTSVLRGAMYEAGRDSTIEGASKLEINQAVRAQVRRVAPFATITFDRKVYSNFSDVGRPEDFTDVNGDGVCNNGEPFEDVNGNGTQDSDRGGNGLGGARDAVLFTANMSYERLFPLAGFLPIDTQFTASASTVLRNQPFENTPGGVPPTGNCP